MFCRSALTSTLSTVHTGVERGDVIKLRPQPTEAIAIAVPGSLTFDDSRAILTALLGGAGLMYAPEPLVTRLIADGTVHLIMEDWAALGPGFYGYYSSRRQLPTGLRLLIDLVRELKPLGL